MTDYICPDCECGFTEKMGKESIDIMPKRENYDSGIKHFLDSCVIGMFGGRKYIIKCPNCGYEF